jgi:hypothetical protein
MQQLYILRALMSLTVLREIERNGWRSIPRSRDDLDLQKLARGEDGKYAVTATTVALDDGARCYSNIVPWRIHLYIRIS